MEIEIRRLIPGLAEDYAHFFDITPHDVNIDEHKCYCVLWRSDDSYAGGDHWFPSREERRDHAIQFVRGGSIQGYLAYCGDEIGMVQRQRGLPARRRSSALLLADRGIPCGHQGKIRILLCNRAENAKEWHSHAIAGACLQRRG